ncbi:three component ABC system middle component [Methylocystis heyeri]|uniref:three component ABC system middle component n=1 Tax=Methylocystis heyeri TaxID=391905 RepID=UPI003CCD3F39
MLHLRFRKTPYLGVHQTGSSSNRNTGLPVWLDRNPGILVDLASRVDASLGLVTEGLRFGCFCQVLRWQGAHILRGPVTIKKVTSARSGEAVAGAMKRAERMGYWLAAVGSQRAVLNMMGLTV